MKNKITTLLLIVLGVLSPVGFSFASDTDLLQPAQVTYNEPLYVPSVHIGGTGGEGGVTYFNGSIVNASVGDVPVTFADDVRIDGMIWRGPSKGTSDGQPLKIADTLMPALTNANDIGMQEYRWKDIYYRGNLYGGSAGVRDITAVTGNINQLSISNSINIGGGYGQTGATLDSGGNLQMDGTLDVDQINWNEVRNNVVSINGAACVGHQGLRNYNSICVGDGTDPFQAYWDVDLPQDSIVTSFSGALIDTDPANDLDCILRRIAVSSSSTSPQNDLGNIATSGSSPSGQFPEDNSISFSNVNNSDYSYQIRCDGAASASLGMLGFRINYTKNSPD